MKNKKSLKKTDILNGNLGPSLFFFSLPIALSGMLQQLFHFADTAVVGRFTDASALAAVGTNGEIVALIVTLSAGLSVGVNVLVASEIGKGSQKNMAGVLRTAWGLAAVCGIVLMVLAFVSAKYVLQWIHTPENAFSQAVLYLRIYALGCPALMFYDFGSAILRAYGDSRRPLLAMIISGFVNLLLNLFFVILCRLGVAGVALATDLSSVLCAVQVSFWVRESDTSAHPKFQLSDAVSMLKIGLPAAVQGAVFCFANIFMQSAVNTFGTTVVAGATAAMNFEYLTYYAITAFGQTATTFTGQNYAAGNSDRCRKIALYCVCFSALCCGCMTTPLVLFRQQAASLFSGDSEVIQAASIRMMMLIFEPVCACYESLSGALRGRGDSLTPAVETVLGTCVLRIVWIQTVFRWIGTQQSLYLVFPVSWIVTSGILLVTYLWKSSSS